MKTSNVLNLRFASDNGRKYNIRIKNPKSNITRDQVNSVVTTLINNRFFDFDGEQGSFSLDSATYTQTSKNDIIPSKSGRSSRK